MVVEFRCLRNVVYISCYFVILLSLVQNMDSDEDGRKPILCFCQGMCPDGIEYGTCHTKPGGKCFTAVELDVEENGKEYPILSYGCLPPNEMALFQCRSTLIATRDRKNIKCCDEYDFCNKHLLPIVEKEIHPVVDYFHGMAVNVLLSSIAVCLLFVIAGVGLTYFKIRRTINQKKMGQEDAELHSDQLSSSNNEPNILHSKDEDSGIRVGGESSNSNGEASDTKLELVERTIAKQITLELMIASGKYSKVWRAKWRGEKVAAKIYNLRGEQNWIREVQIFLTPLIRHEHILGYIGADVKECGPKIKMYLITEHHNRGSLRDYLTHNTVSKTELLQMIKGLASGLNHLHTEIIGSHRKPCIAHNDINSKNILVKKDKECCFGDFTKAIRFFSTQNHMDPPNDEANSELCYLPPEFLENSFNPNTIESYKMGDVYSFALVLWEILNRCEIASLISGTKHQLPYEEELAAKNAECSLDNITEIVVTKKSRPQLRIEWEEDAVLKIIEKIIVECWSETPSVRLTSLRIKKTLFKIQLENAQQIL